MNEIQPDATSLQLDPHGSITPPGPIGRIVRGLLGAVILHHAWQIVTVADARDLDNPVMWASVGLALWLLPAVVNIGFGVDWNRRPQIAAGAVGILAAAAAWLAYGTPLADPVWWWMKATTAYTWSHLGASFVLAAILATPGCEMRSIPDLIARLRRRPAKEHYCPGFIRKIDQWEARLFGRRGHFGPGGKDR